MLYVILRLMPIVRASLGGTTDRWAISFGLLSVGVPAFLLLQVHDYKRLFAFSTVEHMGIILTAAGLGGHAAHYGAMYQMLAHTMTKSFCFFAAGAVLIVTGTRDIASVRGLMPALACRGFGASAGGIGDCRSAALRGFLGEFSILRAGIGKASTSSRGYWPPF